MVTIGIPAGSGQREWITPAEQIKRMQAPIVEELTKVLPIANISALVAEYDPPRWYTALQRIGMLPAQIPALPRNFNQILNGKCPIHGDKAGPNGTSLKIWQTHSLYLIPPGTLNELERRVKAYGQARLAECGGNNPRWNWDMARREYGDIWVDEPSWILMSNGILPESGGQPYKKQIEMVKKLSETAFVNYQFPSLRAAVGVTVLHKVATGEDILRAGNEQNRDVYTYTRVQETIGDSPLAVRGFAPFGVKVASACYDDGPATIGVAVLREF